MNKTVHVPAGAIPFVLASVMDVDLCVGSLTVIPMIGMFGSVIGSIAPDFDTKPMHYTQGKKGLAKVGAKVATKVVNKATGGHRGITHTLLFPVLILLLMSFTATTFGDMSSFCRLVNSLLFGIFSGWMLHIIVDAFNGKGVPILWPFTKSKISLLDWPSVGFMSYVFLVPYSAVWYFIITRLGG